MIILDDEHNPVNMHSVTLTLSDKVLAGLSASLAEIAGKASHAIGESTKFDVARGVAALVNSNQDLLGLSAKASQVIAESTKFDVARGVAALVNSNQDLLGLSAKASQVIAESTKFDVARGVAALVNSNQDLLGLGAKASQVIAESTKFDFGIAGMVSKALIDARAFDFGIDPNLLDFGIRVSLDLPFDMVLEEALDALDGTLEVASIERIDQEGITCGRKPGTAIDFARHQVAVAMIVSLSVMASVASGYSLSEHELANAIGFLMGWMVGVYQFMKDL